MPPKHIVIFQPSGRRGEIEEGKTLRDAAQELGVEIESICGGKQTCGKCKVQIQEGFFEKYGINSKMDNLTEIIEAERKKLKAREIASNHRLACAAHINGPVAIFVPEESRGGGQIVRKGAREIRVKIAPPIGKYYVEIQPPNLHDPMGDLERLLAELRETHGLKDLAMGYDVLRVLPSVLREGDWKATVTTWENEIIRVEPGLVEDSYGLAVDIGTTTVVGYLTDLHSGKVVAVDSMMNPQVAYGEDVMSRITYAMSHEDGLSKMNHAIIEGLNRIVKNTTEFAGLTTEDVLEVVLVGNTAMHHIFLNIDPTHVGLSPFPPTLHRSIDVKARDLGIKITGAGNAHVLPIEAGFVGADNVGVLIATEPYKQSKIALTIDIGTNGELLLGNREKLFSTSCATGPAFEGAHIKHGMRAAPGAIEHLRINPDDCEVEFKVIGKADWHTHLEEVGARGICGSGIIEGVAEMFKAGVIKKNGNFNTDLKEDTPRMRVGEDGPEFIIARKKETAIGKEIAITLGDIRAIQLAKGAMYSGSKILMKRHGAETIDKVILAGAFGSYIDKEAAMIIGLYPDCALKNVLAVGNAAGDGARMALINRAKRREANKISRGIEYVELTVDPDFQTEFMRAMHFPHMTDEFPHIKHILDEIPK
ncbi:MAG: ASKHA domain-containing protein [Candidatus Hydrothermarchaeaceae archaeon]